MKTVLGTLFVLGIIVINSDIEFKTYLLENQANQETQYQERTQKEFNEVQARQEEIMKKYLYSLKF